MSGTYNISPGYDLAQRTVKSVYGLTGYFDYPGPSYLGPVDASFLRKTGFPHKVSLLHDFLFDLEWEGVESELSVLPPAENIDFWSSYMRMSGLDCPEWMCEKEIGSYGTELRLAAKAATEKAVVAAFQLLFRDHEFLFEFQKLIRMTLDEFGRESPDHQKPVHRIPRVPAWLQKAVFYRDMGHCQICFKDVTGEVFPHGKYHLDHILPLRQGGTNDATNFQLLCARCNLQKGSRIQKPLNQQVLFWANEEAEQQL